jgi:hypothetical protein
MPQTRNDQAADLHISAAHAHTSAADAHCRGDLEAADDLSSSARVYSVAAVEKNLEIAKQIPARCALSSSSILT